MGRPPCCDKIGVKKGPWTPEEDLMLVSYVQDHGPGNWRAVPTNTGLMRCSKSCRLRWTNYLRPGIKRGNFTQHEEQLIIHLQALLGNRWAAIASYLPERTDNDIKNYWNTHLNKKLRKLQNGQDGGTASAAVGERDAATCRSLSKGQWERRLQTDAYTAKQALRRALSFDRGEPSTGADHSSIYSWPASPSSQTSTSATRRSTIYASSAENISRLLEGWTTTKKSSPAGSPASAAAAAAAAASNSESTQLSMNYKAGGSADSASSSELQEPYFGVGASTAAVAPSSSLLNAETSRTSIIFPGVTDRSTTAAVAAEAPAALTSVFESWLFDEAIRQLGEEASELVDMAMDDPNGLFQIHQ